MKKWPSYGQIMSMSPKWHLAYFVPIDGHFGQIGRYGLQICFAQHLYWLWYTNQFWSQSDPNWPLYPQKILLKITKMAISRNPILPMCHLPKSLLLLNFSMNLSESFRINVNWIFWRPKSKIGYESISMCKIHIYIDSESFRQIHWNI